MSEPFVVIDGAASLHVLGDRLDPDAVICLIPLRPGQVARKGERLTSPGIPARRDAAIARTGVCFFDVDDSAHALPLNQRLSIMLDAVEPRIAEPRALIAEQDLRWDITVFQSTTPDGSMQSVDPTVLNRAFRLGLPIIVDPDV